jgi:putative ABC transport system permease protein
MNVVTRGTRNAFRNATRTLSIIVILGLSIGLSQVMLIAHQAVQDQIKTTLSSIGNTVSIQPVGGFAALASESNLLTTSELQRVKSIAHVTNVNERLMDRVQTTGTTSSQGRTPEPTTSLKSPFTLHCSGNVCSGGDIRVQSPNGTHPQLPSNFSLDMAIVGTNVPTDPSNIGVSSITITSGNAIDGSKDTNDAMVSKAMANKNNLKVGSTFEAYNKTLTVAAIFDCDTQDGSNTIIVSLPTLQRLTGDTGDVTTATATVDSLENLSATTSAIRTALGSSADVESNVDQANAALQPLDSVKNISVYSLIGAVIAGAAILLLTMIMIVRERKREIGVFKAIGFSTIRIMFQFMAEALTLTLLGMGIGVLVGVLGGNPVTTTLVNNSMNSSSSGGSTGKGGAPGLSVIQNIHAQIGWSIILYGLTAAVIIALVGSALASFFISKVRPAEVLRSE